MDSRLIITFTALLPLTVQESANSLLDARDGHTTQLIHQLRDDEPLEEPDARFATIVSYPAELGDMTAYLAKPEQTTGEKLPAIIWLTGGFPVGGGGSDLWGDQEITNDQSGQQYWKGGVVTMYPALRGSFGNPGVQEYYYGEVNDVLAALEYLQRLDFVDSERIYLGGHSSAGTLALLVAAATDAFKAVFAFGAVADPADYGQDGMPFDTTNELEVKLRSPIHYLDAIKIPTFIIEGQSGNDEDVTAMDERSDNPAITFSILRGANHFNLLAPVNRLIANRIAKTRTGRPFKLKHEQIQEAYSEQERANLEAGDLHQLALLREKRLLELGKVHTVVHRFSTYNEEKLAAAKTAAEAVNFEVLDVREREDRDGDVYYLLPIAKRIKLSSLNNVFAATAEAYEISLSTNLYYAGWTVE